MNEPKSSRYHRLRRRAGFVSLLVTVSVLCTFLWWRPQLSVWAYTLALVVVHELASFPVAFYRGFVIERRYELSIEPFRSWVKDHAKAFLLSAILAVVAAEFIYATIRWSPRAWWLPAAVGASVFTILLARLAPVLLLPLFYKFSPLERPALRERLIALSQRAGVPVLGVYEWTLGARTRRANAALTGSGTTRRILVSDTLLSEYSDDEIEVILAHELAHHVHHDISKSLALEFALLLTAFYGASVAVKASIAPLGLSAVADIAGFPVIVLTTGAVMLVATPFVNLFSRRNERRADRFALALTERHDAFVSAMRRLGSQNLSEENPSRTAVWLFHSHPPIEERIADARSAVAR